jgi:hypothetical protein
VHSECCLGNHLECLGRRCEDNQVGGVWTGCRIMLGIGIWCWHCWTSGCYCWQGWLLRYQKFLSVMLGRCSPLNLIILLYFLENTLPCWIVRLLGSVASVYNKMNVWMSNSKFIATKLGLETGSPVNRSYLTSILTAIDCYALIKVLRDVVILCYIKNLCWSHY